MCIKVNLRALFFLFKPQKLITGVAFKETFELIFSHDKEFNYWSFRLLNEVYIIKDRSNYFKNKLNRHSFKTVYSVYLNYVITRNYKTTNII